MLLGPFSRQNWKNTCLYIQKHMCTHVCVQMHADFRNLTQQIQLDLSDLQCHLQYSCLQFSSSQYRGTKMDLCPFPLRGQWLQEKLIHFFFSFPLALPSLSHWLHTFLLLDPAHSEEEKIQGRVKLSHSSNNSAAASFPACTRSTCSVYPTSFYFLVYL